MEVPSSLTFDKNDPKNRLVQGMLLKHSIMNTSINPNALRDMPFKFNHALPEVASVTNQLNAGTCWIHAGLNIIRRKLITKYKLESSFELSQAYIYKWDKIEKCNLALEIMYLFRNEYDSFIYISLLDHVLNDGGTWHIFSRLVSKYGLVPKEVYPDTFQTTHTKSLNKILFFTIKKVEDQVQKTRTVKEFRKLKSSVLNDCFRIITLCTGNPPLEFKWTPKEKEKERTYTPQSFYKTVIKPLINIEDYISICNFPTEKNGWLGTEYATLPLERGDNIHKNKGALHLNLDITTFKNCIFKSIKDGTGVWFGCDYSQYVLDHGKLMDPKASNMEEMFDMSFTISKAIAIQRRVLQPNHAMLIVGCHKDNDTYERWKVENSHGEFNALKGYITMSDTWLEQFVTEAVVHKNNVPLIWRKQKDIQWLPFFALLGCKKD